MGTHVSSAVCPLDTKLLSCELDTYPQVANLKLFPAEEAQS